MNKPPISSSTSSVINSYRKRRQRRGPNIIYIIAGVLVLGGVILLIVWLTGPSKPLHTLFATETPPPTMTFTPTNTSCVEKPSCSRLREHHSQPLLLFPLIFHAVQR